MNRAIIIGRLTADPELRYGAGAGTAVTKFTLAVDRNFKSKDGKKEADFIQVVVFNKQAENAANYLAKGKMCAVSGRIQTRTYEGNDGQKRYVTEIVADEVQFLERKEGNGQSRPADNIPDFGGDGFTPIEDDGSIPF